MKALRIFLYIIIGIGILLYLAASTASPIRKMNEWNMIATSDSVFMKKYTEIATYPRLLPLVKERAQKEALLAMARQDSVGLIIDLNNKKASLMLKGVQIHTSEIKSYTIDPIFKGIQSPAYRKLFSTPINNISEEASFVKIPIIVRKAPKDTTEAMQIALQMAKNPVAPPVDPAYINFEMEYGFKLIFAQNEWVTEEEKTLQKKFEADMRKLKRENNMNALFNFKNPTYIPSIVLYMEGKEIRAIYRAIPKKTNFVIIN